MLPLLYMPCIATNACPPLKHPVTCAHSTVVNCTERNPSHYSNGKNDFWRECNFFTLATTFTSADYVHHGNYGWEREGRGVVIPCACRNRYVETNARVRSGPFFFFLLLMDICIRIVVDSIQASGPQRSSLLAASTRSTHSHT